MTDATVAIFVAVLLFVLPSEPPRICCWKSRSFNTGELQVKKIPSLNKELINSVFFFGIIVPHQSNSTPRLLTWKVAQKKLPWGIILLLGGGFALAKGSEVRGRDIHLPDIICSCDIKSYFTECCFQVSGLSKWMGDQMTPLQNIPPWAIAIILCLIIAIFTECTSNVATATLFLPVLASMVRTRILKTHVCSRKSEEEARICGRQNSLLFSEVLLQVNDFTSIDSIPSESWPPFPCLATHFTGHSCWICLAPYCGPLLPLINCQIHQFSSLAGATACPTAAE